MTEGSKRFRGFSGLSRTGVHLVITTDRFLSGFNNKKTPTLTGDSPVLTSVGDNPVNPSNLFEPSVIDAGIASAVTNMIFHSGIRFAFSHSIRRKHLSRGAHGRNLEGISRIWAREHPGRAAHRRSGRSHQLPDAPQGRPLAHQVRAHMPS